MGSYIFGILDWDKKILVSGDLSFVKMSSLSFPRKRLGEDQRPDSGDSDNRTNFKIGRFEGVKVSKSD